MKSDPDYYSQCYENEYQVVLGDSWFSSVTTAVEVYIRLKRHFIGIVKTAHSGFPKKFLSEALEKEPAGTNVTLFSKHRGVYLIAMGYKYNKKTVTFFIATLGAGKTTNSPRPYMQRFTDNFGNICEKFVSRNDLAGFYFQHCNVIDTHNNERQYQLRLEKKWLTRDPFFRVCTTLVAFAVTDAYRLYKFNNNDKKTQIGVLKFANILAGQLISNRRLISDNLFNNRKIRERLSVNNFTDKRGVEHILRRSENVKVSVKTGKMYRPARDCVMCKLTNRRSQTVFYCNKCMVPLCNDWHRNNRNTKAERRCFERWHERLCFSTRSSVDPTYDIFSFPEYEPPVGAFELV